MNNNIKRIGLVSGLLLCAAGALAQGTTQPPSSGYFELSAGETNQSMPGGLGGFSSKASDTNYNLSVGSYFPNNFGAELAYNDFGDIRRAGGSTKATGLSLSLVGRFPVAGSVNLLGRLGTTYSSTSVSAAPASGLATGDKQGFGLSYGVGVEYTFNPTWSVLLKYDNYALGFAGDRTDNVGATTIGLRVSY